MKSHRLNYACLFAAVMVTTPVFADDLAYDGRFGNTARSYADTMLQVVRDTFGPLPDGMFLSAMDRKAAGGPAPLTHVPTAPTGVRKQDRVYDVSLPAAQQRLVGANPGHDQQLYQLLYRLGELPGGAAYSAAADQSLGFLFTTARSGQRGQVNQASDLLAWGEHASWDPYQDQAITSKGDGSRVEHEYFEAWRLWDHSLRVARSGVEAHALGLWNHQVIDQSTAEFNRDAPYDASLPHSTSPLDFPRHAGYYIDAWSVALADQTDRTSDATLVTAIDTMLGRYEGKRADTASASGQSPGLIPFTVSTRIRAGIPENRYANPVHNLELAIYSHAAADRLDGVADPALVERLRDFSATEDQAFFLFDHDPEGAGLVRGVDVRDRAVVERNGTLWGQAYGGAPMANRAMILIDRHDQLAGGNPNQQQTADAYAALIVKVADAYLDSDPDGTNGSAPDGNYFDEPIWGQELADVIWLNLFAHEQTGERKYLDRAVYFGDLANDVFFGKFALPRASGLRGHYEAVTGGDDLALALFDLDRAL